MIWAFALDRRAKENVLSFLQLVVADLNTLTGGSKPPVARVHSDQAKEFLSHMVMEWLKDHGIRQTFTSAHDSQANGVAERWINLIKTKATVLLASKYMHTSFWCYAVAWVARCYNQKVLGQKPRKNLPEFGQLWACADQKKSEVGRKGTSGHYGGDVPWYSEWRYCIIGAKINPFRKYTQQSRGALKSNINRELDAKMAHKP